MLKGASACALGSHVHHDEFIFSSLDGDEEIPMMLSEAHMRPPPSLRSLYHLCSAEKIEGQLSEPLLQKQAFQKQERMIGIGAFRIFPDGIASEGKSGVGTPCRGHRGTRGEGPLNGDPRAKAT